MTRQWDPSFSRTHGQDDAGEETRYGFLNLKYSIHVDQANIIAAGAVV